MSQQQLAELLVWVFSVGIPTTVIAVSRIVKRQNENRKNIKVQAQATEEVKTDTDRRFDSLQDTIGIMQDAINAHKEEISALTTKLATANGDINEFKQQLERKEIELQAQLSLNKRVSEQLEDERKSHAAVGLKYAELEEKHIALTTTVSDLRMEVGKMAAIIETYNRIIPLLQTAPVLTKADNPAPDAVDGEAAA